MYVCIAVRCGVIIDSFSVSEVPSPVSVVVITECVQPGMAGLDCLRGQNRAIECVFRQPFTNRLQSERIHRVRQIKDRLHLDDVHRSLL